MEYVSRSTATMLPATMLISPLTVDVKQWNIVHWAGHCLGWRGRGLGRVGAHGQAEGGHLRGWRCRRRLRGLRLLLAQHHLCPVRRLALGLSILWESCCMLLSILCIGNIDIDVMRRLSKER